ncbi:MAG: DUF2791 family P-loop domain-containing protein [Chloroflexi bacterium]|nr:DUF2791 family P-loop domain-containing protein [Chloroflexota bacterium]
MTACVETNYWLRIVRQEYLGDFVKSGGSAVKFAVTETEEDRKALVSDLRKVAEDEAYLFVAIDAAETKVHMIDRVFNSVARQVDWDDLAYSFLTATLTEARYTVPLRKDFNLDALSASNGLDVQEMRSAVYARLRDRLFKDYAMTQEFRLAMLSLCRSQLDRGDVGQGVSDGIKQWLRGDLHLVSALKHARIFQKIGRHNGRDMLFSLAYWLRACGRGGLVISLDISRFLQTRSKDQEEPTISLFYSSPAVIDGYEVLRQFIDGTDELQYCFICVVVPVGFVLTKDECPRGMGAYDALRLRVSDDVSDRQCANPLYSLVRLKREVSQQGGTCSCK